MSSVDLEKSRRYHQEREAQRRASRETERQWWLQRVREVVAHLAGHYPDIQQVYLFGSLVRPGQFRPDSDIDIAISCQALETESLFWRDLERELNRTVDLRPLAGPLLNVVISQGEKLYG